MAQPSSSHRERSDRDRERERSERSSRHHHHRTISSTTLLLVLSLVLAVLAVMLSLPAAQGITGGGAAGDPAKEGLWGMLSPKRSQALVARESSVAAREADVARREAELLVNAPGGVLMNQTPTACPVCPTAITVTEAPAPAQTVIKEVIKEAELTPPGWWDQARVRAEDILDRELKIAEREREISRREEAVNRREHDASRRESWIMEQLVVLNNEEPVVEEEFVYDQRGPKRNIKIPGLQALPPPIVYTETTIEIATETKTVTTTQHHTQTLPTKTVTVPQPANTRHVASPAPEGKTAVATPFTPRTTAVEVVIEDVDMPSPVVEVEVEEPYPPKRRRQPKRSWFGSW
ncbi:hypothetical protein BXZ70DRAFT_915303 [Cristinia sonorae]|uniref:Uncharacterized protein n=1 Tax=Cristinia sonorae TaxID=1940300 RepID=A0A8K0UXZ6_9AGAR|nr:hypothetical protein BXZ70DRAFT_915303 [Cristinia sonorae]